jgi:hypothetical protein
MMDWVSGSRLVLEEGEDAEADSFSHVDCVIDLDSA